MPDALTPIAQAGIRIVSVASPADWWELLQSIGRDIANDAAAGLRESGLALDCQ